MLSPEKTITSPGSRGWCWVFKGPASRDEPGVRVRIKAVCFCFIWSAGMSVLASCHQCLVVLSACSKDCSAAPGRVLKKEELSDPAPRDGTPRPVTAAAQGLSCVLHEEWPGLVFSLPWRWFSIERTPKKETELVPYRG